MLSHAYLVKYFFAIKRKSLTEKLLCVLNIMKEYNNLRVLLIEGRARQVLPMSKALRELGCEVTTYNGSKLDPGYASKYPHRKLLAYCDAHDPDGSYKAIKAELEKYKYDMVIPMNDDVAIILSQYK